MENQVYLYFRTQGTIGNDDDPAQSCLFPASSLAGIESSVSSGVNIVTLFFKSMRNFDGTDQAANAVTISDSVQIELKNSSTVKDFIVAFNNQLNSIASKQKRFFMVADDLSTDEQYFSTLVDGVGTITIAAAHS